MRFRSIESNRRPAWPVGRGDLFVDLILAIYLNPVGVP